MPHRTLAHPKCVVVRLYVDADSFLTALHLPPASSSSLYAAGGDQAKGLAAAIAVVSCEGGASAEAFAEALSQSIQKDPKTGCDVLITAKSYAFAKCGPTGSFAESGGSTTRVRATDRGG